jgi:hypothetical protein
MLKRLSAARLAAGLEVWAGDPAGYCREHLGVSLTPQQEEVCRLLVTPPYKVLVKAAHNVGKSFLAACMVNWWYDCVRPGICLTTAPTDRQVKQILWREVRKLRRGGGFAGPKIPLLEDGPSHFAQGFTARDADRFQGYHEANVFVVFDEAEGVGPEFWEAAQPMLGGDRYAFLAIYNPTSQSSQAAEEERSGGYHVVQMSAIDHPNIAAELAGSDAPYPAAIRLPRLREMLLKWSEPLRGGLDRQPGDVQLGADWFRPGPVAQSRLLGIRPTQAFDAVWGEWVFDLACKRQLPMGGPLQVGCDVAYFGDDDTAIHVRRGGVSVHHESANGWGPSRIAERLRQVAYEWGRKTGVDPKDVIIAIDVCGGYGTAPWEALRNDGYNAVGVNVVRTDFPGAPEFPNLRSALWFGLAEQAALGNVSFARLPQSVIADLRKELLAPLYTIDARGRRVVEPKVKTKARVGRSPDNADATLLAYANVGRMVERVSGGVEVP